MTKTEAIREVKRARKASKAAMSRYKKFLRGLYVYNTWTHDAENALTACERGDEIVLITRYIERDSVYKLCSVFKKRWLVADDGALLKQAAALEAEMRTAEHARINANLALYNGFGLSPKDI